MMNIIAGITLIIASICLGCEAVKCLFRAFKYNE